jgi:hypothetical protein
MNDMIHILTLDVLFLSPAPQMASHRPHSPQVDMWQSVGQATMHDSSSYDALPQLLSNKKNILGFSGFWHTQSMKF